MEARMPAATLTRLSPNEASVRYFVQIETIEGWLEPTAGYLSTLLMLHQNSIGVIGDFCEIGVYKGRYFLALATCLKSGERAVAIDVFDDFSFSEDAAGYDELGVKTESIREGFSSNTARFLAPETLAIIHADSASLSSARIAASGGPFRFFSVDGGHSRAAVNHDLALADANLSDDGILSIDDFQNMQWPGVVTAFFDSVPIAGYVPFAIVPNKLLCSRPDAAARYKTFLRSLTKPLRSDVELSNSLVDYYVNSMSIDQFSEAARSIG
jgi:hypothetical protein